METMSFAGVFDSVLNVKGTIDVLKGAVLTCVKSAFSDRVLDYLASLHRVDLLQGLKMAVLIQPMIKAQLAGTLFTADPDSGDRKTLVIEAVSGQSELVVSGTKVDERTNVSKLTGIVIRREGEPVLTNQQVGLLGLLGKALEQMFGRPQDIEWAIDEESKLWVLQARDMRTTKV
jgi:pyruvate,water dikinase